MKIAIPTNDRKTIAAHTGKCKEFAFFEIENGIMWYLQSMKLILIHTITVNLAVEDIVWKSNNIIIKI